MDSSPLHQVPGPPEMTPVVAFRELSKWYGNVIGVNKLTLEIPAKAVVVVAVE